MGEQRQGGVGGGGGTSDDEGQQDFTGSGRGNIGTSTFSWTCKCAGKAAKLQHLRSCVKWHLQPATTTSQSLPRCVGLITAPTLARAAANHDNC